MNSNRRFDFLLDRTRLPHTTNVNAFILTPAVRVRALKERKYQLPVAIFDVRDVNVLVAYGPYYSLYQVFVSFNQFSIGLSDPELPWILSLMNFTWYKSSCKSFNKSLFTMTILTILMPSCNFTIPTIFARAYGMGDTLTDWCEKSDVTWVL